MNVEPQDFVSQDLPHFPKGETTVKTGYWIALTLVIIGALNWGFVGLFQFDLVAALFGHASPLSRLVYALVGAAGVVLAGIAAATAGSPVRDGSTMATR
jgi:uncharacterized protein